jgi:hypothetical protein
VKRRSEGVEQEGTAEALGAVRSEHAGAGVSIGAEDGFGLGHTAATTRPILLGLGLQPRLDG